MQCLPKYVQTRAIPLCCVRRAFFLSQGVRQEQLSGTSEADIALVKNVEVARLKVMVRPKRRFQNFSPRLWLPSGQRIIGNHGGLGYVINTSDTVAIWTSSFARNQQCK
jgi:hypothetical protein